MIRVTRPASPDELSGVASPGEKERQAVLKHYRGKSTKHQQFGGYAAYKLPAVKKALLAAFHNKCGYCEMGYGGAPPDVEHFRPKGAVVDLHPKTFRPSKKARTFKPGYFSLAAEWTNLLISCIDCNRPRTHQFADEVDDVTGKSNYFPVAGGTRCLNPRKDPEAIEQRLLLDPCRDDPERHLEFGPGGTIRAKEGPDGPDPKGTASIAIYGLQRDLLVRAREERQTTLRFRLLSLRRLAERVSQSPNDDKLKDEWRTVVEEIQTIYLGEDRPFLGMCRQLVRESVKDMTVS